MGKHASLGASSASRWMRCTSSPSLIATLDAELTQTTSIFAEEGSAAHFLAEVGLRMYKSEGVNPSSIDFRGWVIAKPESLTVEQWNCADDHGQAEYGFYSPSDEAKGPHGLPVDNVSLASREFRFTVSDEMQDAVRLYWDTIIGFMESGVAEPRLWIEERVYPLPGTENVFGTADAIIFDEVGGQYWVVDFKYGKGIKVTAQKNAQAMFYASGALQRVGEATQQRVPHDDRVNIVIVQPRVEFSDGRSISDWTTTAGEILEWAYGELAPAIDETSSPALAKYEVGSYCRFCPAAALCPLQQAQAIKTAQEAFGEGLEVLPYSEAKTVELILPSADDADGISAAMKIAAVLDNWSAKVKDLAEVQVKNGLQVPGFKLVRKRANRRWSNPEALEIELEGMGVIGECVNRKLKSPSQLEKLGYDKDFVAERSEKPEGGLTVAPESDPRKEASTAISAFSSFEVEK